MLAVYETPRPGDIPELKSLGKDPLSAGFTLDFLRRKLLGCRQEIKSFLLDQRKIAGLGNIYACEALHKAHIHPARRCHTIREDEAAALVHSIRKVIRTAIRNRGTSFSDFMDLDGRPGDNQHFLCVYQRKGKKCRRCKSLIASIAQGNRSSFFCPGCQR
jgi:formamidopyrimidine-DNA glycosylase